MNRKQKVCMWLGIIAVCISNLVFLLLILSGCDDSSNNKVAEDSKDSEPDGIPTIVFVIGEPPENPTYPTECIIYDNNDYTAVSLEDGLQVIRDMAYPNDMNIIADIKWRLSGKDRKVIIGFPLFEPNDPNDEHGMVSFDTMQGSDPNYNYFENVGKYDVKIDLSREVPIGVEYKGYAVAWHEDYPALIAPLNFTTVDSNTAISDPVLIMQWGYAKKQFALGRVELSNGDMITVITLPWNGEIRVFAFFPDASSDF